MISLDKHSAVLVISVIVAGATFFYALSQPNSSDSNTTQDSVASIKVLSGTETHTENTKPEINIHIDTRKNAGYINADEVIKNDKSDFFQLVNDDLSVDGAKLVTLMSGSDFYMAINQLSDSQNKSAETAMFEDGLNEYVNSHKLNSHFTDYKFSCDDKICLAYFVSTTKEDLDSFSSDFTNGKNSPMHKSGFVNFLIVEVEHGFEYRVSFNSDPAVNSIIVPK